MEKLNSNTDLKNTDKNLQINANASKNNLVWIVVDNFKENDFLTCAVMENLEFLYKIKVVRTANNENKVCGDILKSCNVEYNFLSPDGFDISIDSFGKREDTFTYFEKWKNQYSQQGYYSSVKYGRIPLPELVNYCELTRVIIED